MGKVIIDGVSYEIVPVAAETRVPNRFSKLYTVEAEEYYSYVKERIARAIAEQLIGSDTLELVKTEYFDETTYSAKVYVIKEVRE